MVSDEQLTDAPAGREYARAALAVVCLVAVALASAALPVLAPSGIAGGMPGGSFGMDTGLGPESAGGGFGALNPSSSTDVGGTGGDNPYRSQNTSVHFTVSSPDDAYWRTGAYETYTGSGWDGETAMEPYDGPIAGGGTAAERVSYEVTLARSATAMPTIWRPRTVSRDDARVTEDRAVRSSRPLSPGTRYTATSVRPTDDPAVLRASGRDYPPDVEATYTALPAGSEERLGPFVDDLTADDDTPYETAETVERWLETEKTYSLNASHERGEDVASEFVFEMDAGYCEYFATSMVAMLRTQDIPARYVVGYSAGERTGGNQYTVRGMDAHAWVEVYFEDVGWVRFDPTPAAERRQQEQQALGETGTSMPPETTPRPPGGSETPPGDDQPGGGPTPADGTPPGADETPAGTGTPAQSTTPDPEGTPGESTTPGDSGSSSDSNTSGDDSGASTGDDGDYGVTLNRSATPGATVTVTVTRGEEPVADARVLFNGEPVGRTDADGTVVGTVPYEERLEVTVRPPERQAAVGAPTTGSGPLFAVGGPPAQQGTNESFDLETEATVNASITPAGEVAVVASVEDVPVRDAAVTIDGERVGTTDDDGWAAVALPPDVDNATVRVRRGSVGGETTLTGLRADLATRLPLALPWSRADVTATLNGEPAGNATVLVGGERVATTGADGTATVRLPLAGSATVTVVQHGQRAAMTVDGLGRNLAGVVGAALVILGGVGYAARRRELSPGELVGWLRRAGQFAVGALVGLATRVDTALAALWHRARRTVAHLRALLSGRVTLAALVAAFRQWLADRADAARSVVDMRADTAGEDDQPADPDGDAYRTIQSAWRRFVDCVSVRHARTRTPGEIAAHAVEADDIPPEAVATLRDAFRAVEYGNRDPGERVAGVERAIRTIEAAVGDEDTGADS